MNSNDLIPKPALVNVTAIMVVPGLATVSSSDAEDTCRILSNHYPDVEIKLSVYGNVFTYLNGDLILRERDKSNDK